MVPLKNFPNIAIEYEELVGLEQMKQQYIFIGKLKEKFSVQELLDGIEKPEERQMKDEKDGRHIHVAGDYIEGDKNEVGINYGEVVFGGKKIKIEYKNEYGLSSGDFAKLIEGMKRLSPDQWQQLKEPIKELSLAKTEDDKKSPAEKFKGLLVDFGISAAGSLTANGVWELARKLIELWPN